jgi:DNA-binding XRE family transcriptional regulator
MILSERGLAVVFRLPLKLTVQLHYNQDMATALMADKKGFFAVRLRELRQAADLSQAKLAERAGLGLSTVVQFESGLREPTFETLLKLAEGLGVELAAFQPDRSDEKPAAEESKKPARRGK